MILAYFFPFAFLINHLHIIKASIINLNNSLEDDFISSLNLLNENSDNSNELHIACNQTLLNQYNVRTNLTIK